MDKKMNARSGPYRRPSWTHDTHSDDGRGDGRAPAAVNESDHSDQSEGRVSRTHTGDNLEVTPKASKPRDKSQRSPPTASALGAEEPKVETGDERALVSNGAFNTGTGILRSFSAPISAKQHVQKESKCSKHDWVVGDRILGCGPLRPRGSAENWNHTSAHAKSYPRRRDKPSTKEQGSPSVSPLLDGSDDAVVAASTVVEAAKATVSTSPPVRGADSLLRTTLRYALKGAPSL